MGTSEQVEVEAPGGPLTLRAMKVLEYAVEEADLMGHELVGTHHILLGLLREGQGIAIATLMCMGLEPNLETARAHIRRLTGAPESDTPAISTPLSEVSASESTSEQP